MRILGGIMFLQQAFAGTISLPQASAMAKPIDTLHDFIFWLSVFFLALVTFGLVWLIWKYHRSRTGRQTEYILGSHFLETLWTVIPLILMLVIFAWGYKDYVALRTELRDALEINVVGRQWMWNIEYANGRKTLNELYLPKGRPVKLILSSEDVIHSFFIANFRLKQDVVPGIYTSLSFVPTETGTHPVYCAEYCGTGHSDMLGKAIVVEPADFDRWLETGQLGGTQTAAAGTPGAGGAPEAKPMAITEKGKFVFESKGCFACHSVDGTPKVGPTLKDVFGKVVEIEGGGKAKVDENYIRESMMDPQKSVVKGFPPSMPTFRGLLDDEEINSLIAYIKSLK